MKEMKSSGHHSITAIAEVDETIFSEKGIVYESLSTLPKNWWWEPIEIEKWGGLRYAQRIYRTDNISVTGFMIEHLVATSKVTTEQWTGYCP